MYLRINKYLEVRRVFLNKNIDLTFMRINICTRIYQIFKNFARAVQNPNDSVHNFIKD